jgi:hypothetical protein
MNNNKKKELTRNRMTSLTILVPNEGKHIEQDTYHRCPECFGYRDVRGVTSSINHERLIGRELHGVKERGINSTAPQLLKFFGLEVLSCDPFGATSHR